MKNKYYKSSKLSEHKFRELLKFFASDVPALKTAELTNLNKNTVHVIYNKLRERIAELSLLKGKILEETTVYTDGWRSYHGLIYQGFEHYRIYHSKNEFARGKNHINGIESFWSFAKTRMQKLRGIRSEKFVLHLKESEWRWNHRNENIYKILLKKLRARPLF